MNTIHSSYEFAHEFALFTNKCFFLTGKAGTGKTTFLRQLKQNGKKQMAVVAPTGVAAINAGGTTIHSFFQLPISPFIPTDEGKKQLIDKIKMQSWRRNVLQELELLVIDEISMVRADVVDAIDTLLRHFRYRRNEPFGGVQVIFIGDLYQLSPIATDDEWHILSEHYKSIYFFESKIIRSLNIAYIELDKIYRQTNQNFIDLLNEIRNNTLTHNGLKLLASRYDPTFIAPDNSQYITLTTHNYKADKINEEELMKIDGSAISFEAHIEGDFPEKSFPTEQILELKIGAKVMYLKNDSENPRRFFNGKIGVIEEFNEKEKLIKIVSENEEPVWLGRMTWENIRYVADSKTKQIQENILGKFVQFPLRLAWAITIHKSQGLTFDNAIIDAGDAFAAGQVYVALSRCRSIEGMVLRSHIHADGFESSREIVDYEKNKPTTSELESELNDSKIRYKFLLISGLFNFDDCSGLMVKWMQDTTQVKTSFNDETFSFLENVAQLIEQLADTGKKFRHQLSSIFVQPENNTIYLNERVMAACTYFSSEIDKIASRLKESPALTDSRENARQYNDNIQNIYGILSQRLHILKELKLPFDPVEYFVLKSSFILKTLQSDAYTKISKNQSVNLRNKLLYYKLIDIRNKICENEDLPVYLVANSKSLMQMSDYLPLTKNDLLKIHGFGKTKILKFGDQFLNAISEYCRENNLNSRISELGKMNEPEKKKKEKGETYKISFEMYREGKTINEIAAVRNLTVGTIASHLCKFIDKGWLDIEDFISVDKLEAANEILEKGVAGPITEALSNLLNKTEIPFFLYWYRKNSRN